MLPIAIDYRPMGTIQGSQGEGLGLGSGVSFSFSVYDSANQMLMLSTGESYPVLDSPSTARVVDADGGVVLPLVQSSLDNIRFKRYDSCSIIWQGERPITSCYKVIHKSGDIEILMGPSMGGVLKLPQLMVDPAGHALTFQWTYDASRNPQLQSITDDTRDINGHWTTLLSVVYSGVNRNFTFFPGTPESYEVDLTYDPTNTLLMKVENKSVSPSLVWTLGYSAVANPDPNGSDLSWLTDLTGPGGMTEHVDYASIHKFPLSAALNPLCAVTTLKQDPKGGQPPITTTFAYTSQTTGTNFVAGGTTISSWASNRDNLYDYPGGGYTYGSTQTCGDCVTTYTFDKFHLQTRQVVTRNGKADTGSKTIITATSYYGNHNLPYDSIGCAYFQFPLTRTMTWVDGVDPASDPCCVETTHYGQDQEMTPGWDKWGNPLRKTDPNGLTTTWEYYDGSQDNYSGSILLCPKDPNGFTRFTKSIKVDPSTVTSPSVVPGAPVQQTNYTYAKATPAMSFNQSYVDGLVLQAGASRTSGGTVLSETVNSYDAEGSLNAGRVTKQVFTHYPNGKRSVSSESYTTTATYQYVGQTFAYPSPSTVRLGALTTTQTVTVQDPDVQADPKTGHPAGVLTATTSHTMSLSTTRTLREIDTLGNATIYTYDNLGRLTQRMLNATSTSGYVNTLTYAYVINGTLLGDEATYPLQVRTQDPRGNKVCYTQDGLNRVIQRHVNAVDVTNGKSKWWAMEKHGYDSMGRLSSRAVLDYDVNKQGETTATYTLSTAAIEYDNWGHTRKVTYSDNTTDMSIYDPVNKMMSAARIGVSSDGQKTTLTTGWNVTTYDYNFSRKPVTVERRHSASAPDVAESYSLRRRQYNGLYWVIADTDELGRTTSYEYDGWGRVTCTTLPATTIQLPNGKTTRQTSSVISGYCPKSPAKWVESIQVTGKPGQPAKAPFEGTCTVGSRHFDGLGRVVDKTVGGCAWKYHYPYDATVKDGYMRPSAVDTPDGYTRKYQYVYELDEALQEVSIDSAVTHNYHYEPVSGIVGNAGSSMTVEGLTQTSGMTFNAFASGRLQGETITYTPPAAQHATVRGKDIPSRKTAYTYTIGGALSTYVHVDEATSTISRDRNGRIESVSDGSTSVTPQYDLAGRLTGWVATSGSHTVSTTLTLDDFGRETQRVIADGSDTWTITQNPWQRNDLLAQRVVQRSNSQGSRAEIYSYDERNRLTIWDGHNAGASNLPSFADRYGNTLMKQAFTLDALNNITAVVTSFGSGNPLSNTTTFTFDYNDDPCRLLGGANSSTRAGPSAFDVQYDNAGRITNDGQGTTLSYDPLGRVRAAESTLTGLSGAYGYDPFHRQGVQTSSDPNQSPACFYYRSNELVNLVQGDNSMRLLRSLSGAPAAQINGGGEQAGAWLLGTDRLGSVLTASNDQAGAPQQRAYSAYGEEPVPKAT